ncbi:MAG: c-type cytochrome [Nitrosomonadales bacterium]|nr:c-type cytochrome [Nitrosomonadales bacterium]
MAAKPEVKVGSAVSEEDAMRLAKNNNCLVCHAIDRKLVGPAWRDVAAKYRANSDAEAMLMNKIAKGGSGAWGSVVMPSYPRISEAERKILAGFVLSL